MVVNELGKPIGRSTKAWLQRGWRIHLAIRQLEDARRKAFDEATGTAVDYRGGRVQGGCENAQENKMASYAAYSSAIEENMERMFSVKREILEAIEQVEDGTLRALLIARYINFKTWEQVAVEMNYSYSQVVKYLHPKALHAIECHIHSAV